MLLHRFMALSTLMFRIRPARSLAVALQARSRVPGSVTNIVNVHKVSVRLSSQKDASSDLFGDFNIVDVNWKPGNEDENDCGETDSSIEAGDDMDARIAQAITDKRKGRVVVPKWLVGEEALGERPQYALQIDEGQCTGCGIKLQLNNAALPGFVPEREKIKSTLLEGEEASEEDEASEKVIFCQRCFRLRNYGKVEEGLRPGFSEHEALSPGAFKQLLSGIAKKNCVVVTMVDVFDFHGSILPDLASLVGRNPLFVAVNKVDLLPSDYSETRVKQWVLRECREFGGLDRLRLSDIHLVSAKTGLGVRNLLEEARELASQRKCDVYVAGAANVGKSSFLNRLSNREGGRPGSSKKRNAFAKEKEAGITTSSLPGTTLDFIKLDVGKGVALVDTPGLILSHQLTSSLLSDELKAVFPERSIEEVTLRVGEGKSVMLGGLARMEFVEGLPFFFTFFVAPDVVVHASSTTGADADAFVAKHTGGILKPPFLPERAGVLASELVSHDIEVQGCGWREASCDIVLSGLGWISVTGSGSCRVRVIAPAGVMVVQRDPLLPFEARDSMGRSTGGKIIKNSKKKAAKAKKTRGSLGK